MPDKTSQSAEEGTLAHSVCELTAQQKFTNLSKRTFNSRLKKLKADPLWSDEMLTTANTYVEHLLENAMHFASAPYVALEVKVDLSDYVPDSFGTCDCVMIGGNTLIITDYKHGKIVPVTAERNSQMMSYALGALKLYRPIYGDTIKQVSLYIDQPRMGIYSTYSLSVDELYDWGENVLKPKAAVAYAGEGELVMGDWCRFCRVKPRCRAHANGFTALEDFKDCLLPTLENMKKATPDSPHLLDHSEIGDLLRRGAPMLAWYNSLKEYALSALLKHEMIPGWKAVEGRSVRAWRDQDKALETILAAGHQRELVFDTVPKSLAQLEKMMGPEHFRSTVGDFIVKPPGKPALAPEDDPRPAYSSAAADFKGA